MLVYPTSAVIDGHSHKVVHVEECSNSVHSHRIRFACGLGFDLRGVHQFQEERWNTIADPCPVCSKGIKDPAPLPITTTVLADISTGLPCPKDGCGGLVRISQKTGACSCDRYGHEFTVPAVLAASLGIIKKLAEGKRS